MTSKLTRERLEKIKSWRETYGAGSNVMLPAEEAEELACLALAAMDSEPVAYISKSDFDAGYPLILARRDFNKACTMAVYAAQPAPVVSAELLHTAASAIEDLLTTKDRTGACVWFDLPFRLRSAANAQPAPEYPETLPCPVLLEPGMRFGKGVKTRLVLDAIQRRAEHYAELEAMTPEERAEYDAGIEAFKAMLPQPALVVPDEIKHRIGGLDWGWEGEFNRGWNACRAAMLQAEPVRTCLSGDGSLRWPCQVHPGSSPVIPDGYVMVPMRLTAENGAKGALSGEFSETKFVNCPECFGDDECETCDGSGRIEITVPVTWTTIKEIWAKGVEHFAAAPQSPGGDHATVPGKWIPVSERLPEDSGRYWCYVEEQNDLGKSHYQWNCSWNGDRWWVESEGGGIVTHWMPLPAAPQEVNRE